MWASKFVHEFTVSGNITSIITASDGTFSKALFSPQDNIKETVIGLIKSEKEKICVASYTLTDQDIAKALIKAKKRGMQVELIVDKCYQSDKFSKVALIAQKGIPVFVFQPMSKDNFCDVKKAKAYGLMHNKFLIFYNNLEGKKILMTGSFNLTRSANEYNKENIVILENKEIIQDFDKEFSMMKKQSVPLNRDSSSFITTVPS